MEGGRWRDSLGLIPGVSHCPSEETCAKEESRVGHSPAASANSGPPSLPQSHRLLWWQLTPASQLDDQDWHLGPSRPTVASAVPTPLRALS